MSDSTWGRVSVFDAHNFFGFRRFIDKFLEKELNLSSNRNRRCLIFILFKCWFIFWFLYEYCWWCEYPVATVYLQKLPLYWLEEHCTWDLVDETIHDLNYSMCRYKSSFSFYVFFWTRIGVIYALMIFIIIICRASIDHKWVHYSGD